MVLFFSVRGDRKCEINYEKKEKNFFSPLGSFLTIFVVSFPEKMIRKFFGEGEEVDSKKKSNFKKKLLSAFFGIMGRKKGVCVGRCMCLRNHGGRKVI